MTRWSRLRALIGGAGLLICALAGPAGANGNEALDISTPAGGAVPPYEILGHGGYVMTANEVLLTARSGDRTMVVAFSPPSGVSPAALAAALEAAGARPAASVAAGCSYARLGSARTLCPVLRWSRGGYARPRVYFVDHTGWQWPVSTATGGWNGAPGIDSYYLSGGCPAGGHCVDVWSADYGNTCWQGASSWSYDGNGFFLDGSVAIWLNEYNGRGTCGGRTINYAKNSAGYLQDVCHEQGHTLGLDHNSSTGSCLYADIINASQSRYPGTADLNLLGWLYR